MDENRSGSLADVALAVDTLVVLARAGLQRALLAMVVSVIFLSISTVSIGVLLFRTMTQADRLDALATRIEEIATDQTKTRQAAEETKERVDTAADIADSKPTLEIVPATSSGKASAVVVIKPAKSKAPKGFGSAEPAPPGPTIEIPVKLPEGSQVSVPDAGAAKK